MQKIPTLFRRDPADMRRVLPEVYPECAWVLAGFGQATRKYDGTCMMLDVDGAWWARREVKPGKTPPAGYVPISEDPNTGKIVGWEPVEQSAFAKFHAEALAVTGHPWECGTYELVGPKINGNPEGYGRHLLVAHARAEGFSYNPRDYVSLAHWMTSEEFPWEGIVWHWEQPDGSVKMAKLKRRDFA